MPQQLPQIEQSKKARIQLALKAIKQDPTIPLRRVAADYNVPSSTLSDRRAGRPSQADRRPKTMNLGKTEEEVIVGSFFIALRTSCILAFFDCSIWDSC